MSNSKRHYVYYSTYKVVDTSETELDYSSNSFYEIEYSREDNKGDFVYSPSKYYYLEPKHTAIDIRWYRYELGAAAADEYSGVYWTRIDETDPSVSDTYLINDYSLVL